MADRNNLEGVLAGALVGRRARGRLWRPPLLVAILLGIYSLTLGDSAPHAAATPLSGVASINSGYAHTCAVTSGGQAQCWGLNYSGQLGDGTTDDRTLPVDVIELGSSVSSLSADGSHTCALTTGGGAKCWGSNDFGELGNGSAAQGPNPSPGDVTGLTSGVLAIDAGTLHTCALTAGGTAMCWGANFSGEVGDGTTTQRNDPVPVLGLDQPAASINAGNNHTCAVVTGGSASCWGGNYGGQLGDGGACGVACPSPVDVAGLGSILSIDAGGGFTCAVTTAGGAKCWGSNYDGQLGDGGACGGQCAMPVDVSGLTTDVAAVSAGDNHACAVTTGGGVKCWGANYSGQLGDSGGCGSLCFTPVDAKGLGSGVIAVSAGGNHTCALLGAGGVKCWGENLEGQLGDGSYTRRLQPVDVVERRFKDFPGFIFPMECTINVDCFYINYIDHDPSAGLEDFMCGAETYDGHGGTDIVLPSFHEMDAGVDVYAAAAGTVVESKDGHFDRNKFLPLPDFFVPSNYVIIEHPGGLFSLYHHLRQGSVLVSPGADVDEGQKIGEVGSSGRSSAPHLHFEVFDAEGYVIDPWAGPCGGSESLWQDQDPYEDSFILIESYLTVLLPADPRHDPDSIEALVGSAPSLCFSVFALSIHPGDESEFRFVGPGTVPSFHVDHTAYQRWSYHGSCKPASEFRHSPGAWQMQYWLNGELVTSRDFEVELSAGDASCNGTADSIDALLLLQHTAGLLNSLACPAGDVNSDGQSDALDALLILQYVAGLIGSLPP